MAKYRIILLLVSAVQGEISMAKVRRLATYQKKRDFLHTAEPSGKEKKSELKKKIFVIQEHHARHLHFDFRLEIDGVLVSWAVPKGVPKRAGIKRLAVRTEDHPLAYAHFAGTIPPGNYGAGEVYIQDYGTYENIKTDKNGMPLTMAQSLRKGAVEFCLEGSLYRGCYALIRTNFNGSKNSWLLMKIKKAAASDKKKG